VNKKLKKNSPSGNMQYFNRREFIKFMGGSTAAFMALSLASSCSGAKIKEEAIPEGSELPVMNPSTKDELGLAPGLNSKIFLKEGMSLSGKSFGHDNDFIAFIPTDKLGVEGFLWINHEHFAPLLLHKTSLETSRREKQLSMLPKKERSLAAHFSKLKKAKKEHLKLILALKSSALMQRHQFLLPGTSPLQEQPRPLAWLPIVLAAKLLGILF